MFKDTGNCIIHDWISIISNSRLPVLTLPFQQLLTLSIIFFLKITLFFWLLWCQILLAFALSLWLLSVSFADVLSSTWPLKFAPAQGSFLCHFIFSRRQSPLQHGFSYNSCSYDSHIYSSRAKLQTHISSWLLETLLGYQRHQICQKPYSWSFSSPLSTNL